MKVVYPIAERCMNCHLCEVACIVEHSRTRDPIGAYHLEGLRFNWESPGEFADSGDARSADQSASSSRCKVWDDEYSFISTMCRHCQVAECVLACKNGALYKDESGRVLVDEEKCVGCWMCVMACPFGGISRNTDKGNIPQVNGNGINHHCDLCPGREIPACVAVCPTQALVYEERQSYEEEVA